MDRISRINMLARQAGMSYGQYRALLYERSGYVASKIPEIQPPEEPEAAPKPTGRVCAVCGRTILGKIAGRQKTCSRDCAYQLTLKRARANYRRNKGIVEPIRKTCVYCGTEFEARRRNQRFCREKCRDTYKAAVYRGAVNPTIDTYRMDSRTYGKGSCQVCGAEFTKRAPNKKYCSQACANTARKQYHQPAAAGERNGNA